MSVDFPNSTVSLLLTRGLHIGSDCEVIQWVINCRVRVLIPGASFAKASMRKSINLPVHVYVSCMKLKLL